MLQHPPLQRWTPLVDLDRLVGLPPLHAPYTSSRHSGIALITDFTLAGLPEPVDGPKSVSGCYKTVWRFEILFVTTEFVFLSFPSSSRFAPVVRKDAQRDALRGLCRYQSVLSLSRTCSTLPMVARATATGQHSYHH